MIRLPVVQEEKTGLAAISRIFLLSCQFIVRWIGHRYTRLSFLLPDCITDWHQPTSKNRSKIERFDKNMPFAVALSVISRLFYCSISTGSWLTVTQTHHNTFSAYGIRHPHYWKMSPHLPLPSHRAVNYQPQCRVPHN